MRTSFRCRSLLLAALCSSPALLHSQATQPPALDFSGVIFANYHVRTDSAARALNSGRAANRFDVQRVYLNFRMPAGDRVSIRVTTDVFFPNNPPGNTIFSGMAVRLKYAYLQYNAATNLAGVDGLGAVVRLGMLHNVIIEHIDAHWPRWLGVDALETHGYFASADVGAATLVTLPRGWGETYATIMNGNGYTVGETDRFKDFAARFSVTPFASDSGFWRSLSITPWYSKGAVASQFVLGGPAQLGPVSEGLLKDRRGVFLGLRDRRLTGGVGLSQRVEEVESGANTLAVPRVLSDRTSRLIDAFALVRPVEIFSRSRSRFGLVGRFDSFKLDQDGDAENQFIVAGAFYDMTARTSVALDYQELSPRRGSTTTRQATWFLHVVANF
jgi:hypothetical protein